MVCPECSFSPVYVMSLGGELDVIVEQAGVKEVRAIHAQVLSLG